MDELPQGWVNCTIGDITAPISTIDQRSAPERVISYIDISGIDNATNRIAETKPYLLKEAPSRARQIVHSGDTVFSTVRPYLRNIAQVPDALDGEIASTGFSVLRPAPGLDARLLFFKATSQPFVDALTRIQYGASYPAVKDEQVRAQPFALPPLAEQERIVEKIETLFAEIDKGEEALRAVRKLLARYRQSVLKAAVTGALTADWRAANGQPTETGQDLLTRILKHRRETWQGRGRYVEPAAPNCDGLPDLPDGWAWASVEQLALVIGGLTKNGKRSEMSLTRPMLRVANVYQNRLELDDVHFTGITERELDRVLLVEGDLLVVEGNGSKDQIGRMAIWRDEIPGAVHQNHLIKIRMSDTTTSSFAMRWFESPLGRQAIERVAASTSGLYTLSISKIESLVVPLPGMTELQKIVEDIDEAFAKIELIEKWSLAELKRSAALRQSILKDAFAGKLVPQDPADEPAADLLARIRATPAAAPRRTRRTAMA
ncbi:restriction endonuclease subunit S [Novosphingobium sp.]|uniref:restriction endonuclease subunit S n=1 Tax=Novosphingobium sp. TaxID=1874826 RepID=UPI002605E7E6|nr:restriction endonuclease subunit S [Novosphingobium sp.]